MGVWVGDSLYVGQRGECKQILFSVIITTMCQQYDVSMTRHGHLVDGQTSSVMFDSVGSQSVYNMM